MDMLHRPTEKTHRFSLINTRPATNKERDDHLREWDVVHDPDEDQGPYYVVLFATRRPTGVEYAVQVCEEDTLEQFLGRTVANLIRIGKGL